VLKRLKQALVDSYVGAIALGYLLAQCILHFVSVFASPLAGWVTRSEYKDVIAHNTPLVGFTFKDALPEFVRFLLLLVVWYVLVRWLYFTPVRRVSLKAEVYELTSDELLKRMPKEQAIAYVQSILRRMEESLNDPDIPAAKIRMEKVLEELKLP